MPLCDASQYMHLLSATESGRVHEKKLADEYALHLPAGHVLRQNLGLLGHAPAGVVVEMPHQKPPKRKLTFAQKLYTHLLSPLRVVLEHAHSGIKRLHMVQGTIRLRGEWVRDTVMVVACGLHNLRVRSPQPAPRLSRAPARETPQLLRVSFNIIPELKFIRKGYKGAGKLQGKVTLIMGDERAVVVYFAREGADVAICYFPTE